MALRLGVNGFGRIGRLVLRAAVENKSKEVQVVAINDPFMDIDYLIYQLKYDSAHLKFGGKIERVDDHNIKVNGNKITLFKEKDPALLKWGSVGADFVCESTGAFLT